MARSNSSTAIVPETANTLEQAVLSGESLYLVNEKDVASLVVTCNLDGAGKQKLAFPGKASCSGRRISAIPQDSFSIS